MTRPLEPVVAGTIEGGTVRFAPEPEPVPVLTTNRYRMRNLDGVGTIDASEAAAEALQAEGWVCEAVVGANGTLTATDSDPDLIRNIEYGRRERAEYEAQTPEEREKSAAGNRADALRALYDRASLVKLPSSDLSRRYQPQPPLRVGPDSV